MFKPPKHVRYRGLTYPKEFDNAAAQKRWKKNNCPKNIHLFDECRSDVGHRLVCDACGFTVHILGFETEDETCARVRGEEARRRYKANKGSNISRAMGLLS